MNIYACFLKIGSTPILLPFYLLAHAFCKRTVALVLFPGLVKVELRVLGYLFFDIVTQIL